jgi:hypothetical protein
MIEFLCEALNAGHRNQPFVRVSSECGRDASVAVMVAMECIMRWTLMGSSLTRLLVLLTLSVTMGLGLSVAGAQTGSQPTTSGYGQYYVEFRSRQAWDYGHTFVVFGRVGETPGKKNVAGLSPKGDDPKMWLMGHYMPVPADTGWTDGDLEDRYITSRYRVLLNKDQYDRVVAHIRDLQSRSHVWSVEMYNCNAFVADIATFMGLKVPASSWIYPRVFVSNLRKVNTGHPEAAAQLISDNLKEMSSPTRDGRAMIAAGMIHPGATATTEPASSGPSVTIGAVRVTNRPASSAEGTQNSSE